MSKSSSQPPPEKFQFASLSTHWHDESFTKSLGCQGCVFHRVCGGLQVEAGIFDCQSYCRCTDKAACDNVCPHNPAHHVSRSLEVKGFEFTNVPAARAIAVTPLPLTAPMIFHGSCRARALDSSTVVLSLFQMFRNDGTPRFSSRAELIRWYRLRDDAVIILSGVHEDYLIERWWRMKEREAMTRSLASLGVALITTPNYSLFGDVPRLDNLFNMKRIALVWSEIQKEGVPCALHINARTPTDYDRWTVFLRDHPEISHVAFEFATGAGTLNRIDWHVNQLRALARRTPQPLHLIARGGINILGPLRQSFAGLTFVDTGSFVRTQRRQRLTDMHGQLVPVAAPTAPQAPLDDLLESNIAATRQVAERSAATR